MVPTESFWSRRDTAKTTKTTELPEEHEPMDAVALCDECGAPRGPGASICGRCGEIFTQTVKAPRANTDPTRVTRAWDLAVRATVAFVLAGQVTQWLSLAHAGRTTWGLARAFVTLAVGIFAGWQLHRRSEVTLVLWGWVMYGIIQPFLANLALSVVQWNEHHTLQIHLAYT